MKFKPLHDRILVKRATAADRIGGILLPETSREKPFEGTVVAVGPGAVDHNGKIVAMQVTVGAEVLFTKYTGSEIIIDGDTFIVMRESDLLGIVE
jgi:chaperonin GroES